MSQDKHTETRRTVTVRETEGVTGTNKPEKEPGPYAQDPDRTPPTREEREGDYAVEKRITGNAAKK